MSLVAFDIFEESNDSFKTMDDAYNYMTWLRRRYGIANLSYWKLGKNESSGRAGWISTYDENWIRRYRMSGYITVDPVFKASFARMLPLDWDEVNAATPKAREICNGAEKYGIIPRGMSFPIVDASGARALFSINTDMDEKDWRAMRGELAASFHLIAHYFHQRVREMLDGSMASANETVLSVREREVLLLAAEGKTGPQTAKLLKLSVSAVRLYTSNAMQKLGASNKTQAVAIAYQKGLL
jgi:DNA-binding CsgD family transcriptional regulator